MEEECVMAASTGFIIILGETGVDIIDEHLELQSYFGPAFSCLKSQTLQTFHKIVGSNLP